jgi:hypothetical protein
MTIRVVLVARSSAPMCAGALLSMSADADVTPTAMRDVRSGAVIALGHLARSIKLLLEEAAA